jgi:hypothetical protein
MVVQEFGQLLAQAFVALGFVAQHDGPLEQGVLQLVRQAAPQLRHGGTEDQEVSVGVCVASYRMCLTVHNDLSCSPILPADAPDVFKIEPGPMGEQHRRAQVPLRRQS